MGNEDKVKDLINKSKSTFLPADFHDFEAQPNIYALGDEFAKTKKNRAIIFKLVVVGFLGILIGVTVFITDYVQEQYRNRDIQVSGFEDLQLRELFDTAKKNQKELERIKAELGEAKKKMQQELASATSEDQREQIRLKYGSTIAEKNKLMAKKQRDIDNYDLKLRENIRRAEAIVNNYKQLHELRMKEQQDKLINLYNPTFSSPELNAIFRAGIDASLKEAPAFKEYNPELQKERVLSKEGLDEIHRKLSGQLALLKRLNEIPYINSVKPSLRYIDNYSKAAIRDYEALWSKLAAILEKKNRALANYQYAFAHLTRTNPESGYVVDPRDSRNIGVYINNIYGVKEGDTAMVFRSDDEYIGKIQFFMTKYGLKAKAVEIKADKEIEPFDKILIKRTGGEIKKSSEDES